MKTAIARTFGDLKKAGSTLTGSHSAVAAAALVTALVLSIYPVDALAAGLSIPFIDGVGCQVANWMKGPLAILVFIVVVISTLVIGLITKMDWGKIISIAIIFGIIQGLVSILLSTGNIQLPSCLAA